MKTRLVLLALAAALTLPSSTGLFAGTTLDPANHYAYGANLGWVDGRGDTNNGAVIGEYVCSGSLYAANVGWISLGGGSPANGIRYQNASAGDYGVNQDGLGNLRGYAYGANIGWVAFESTGAPRVDLVTGNFTGYAYSANCGWISLSNAMAFVQTDTIAPGIDSDGDGIADAWELTYTNTLRAFTASSDTDHDGSTDLEEYLAGTNPLDPNDNLRITLFTRVGTYNTLWWTSEPDRFYRVERRAALGAASPWETYLSYDLLNWSSVGFNSTAPQHFYRIRAVRPLMP
jgi:Bacterial TSP3 repeat